MALKCIRHHHHQKPHEHFISLFVQQFFFSISPPSLLKRQNGSYQSFSVGQNDIDLSVPNELLLSLIVYIVPNDIGMISCKN